jgi:hypothetical protein
VFPAIVVVLAIVCWGCAPRVSVSLPGGTGRPDAGAPARFAAATAECGATRTWSGELRVSGRVRGDRVRGRLLAGSTKGGDLRLEAVAPFGAPLFVLAARSERATLLLPRESRALRDEPAADVLEALVGLRLTAADLHSLLTGCVAADPAASNGRAFADDWTAVDIGQGRTAFVRESAGGPRVEAARLGHVDVGYAAYQGHSPREIRLVSRNGSGRLELLIALSQVERNVDLPEEAFRVDVPPEVRPLALDELARRGLAIAATPPS